jgi:hypothetical protein
MTLLELVIAIVALLGFIGVPLLGYLCWCFGNDAIKAGRRVRELEGEVKELEKAAALTELPVLYDLDLPLDTKMPLTSMPYSWFQDLGPAKISVLAELLLDLSKSESAIDDVALVIETDRGVFVRTIGMFDRKIVEVNDDEIHANLEWRTIYVGQKLTIHSLKFVYHGGVLADRPEFANCGLCPGDELRLQYTCKA